MNSATPLTQTKPDVFYWNRGKRPEEQGWMINNTAFSLSDLTSARSFVELQNKGVPSPLCEDAKRKGYAPAEFDEYLGDMGY